MYNPPHTSDSGFDSRNAFVYIRGSYSSKNIAKSRGSVNLRLGRRRPAPPRNRRLALSLTPRSYTSGKLQSSIFGWMFIYAYALLRKPIKIVRAQPEQTVTWPKHADESCSQGTFRPAGSSAAIPWDLWQVTGPSQCPRVDEPHLASIACAWPPVAGSARKGVAHALRYSTGVAYGHQCKVTQDSLNGNAVQDRFLVV
jgi:hypothetical protein